MSDKTDVTAAALSQLREDLAEATRDSFQIAHRLKALSERVAALDPAVQAPSLALGEALPDQGPQAAPAPPADTAAEPTGPTAERSPATDQTDRGDGAQDALVGPAPTQRRRAPRITGKAARLPDRVPSLGEMNRRRQERSQSRELALGQKWLLIAGVVMVVLGIGYFLKYSFDQNWIGPAGRVALAFLAGGASLGAGERFRKKGFDGFGLALIGGGIATLYFSGYAAFQIYDLIGQLPAFGFMVLVTALAGALSLIHDTKWLAVLGIVGGFVTPILLSTGTNNQVGLMTYMLILNAGVLWISRYKRWALLSHLGFFFTWAIFAGWSDQYYDDSAFWLTLFYLNAFFLAYAVAPFLYYAHSEEAVGTRGFGVTLPNAFIAFGFSWAMIEDHFDLPAVSLVAVLYAGLYFAMAQNLYKRKPEASNAFVMLLGQGLIFLIVAVPLLFSDSWITLFWAVQAAVLIWAATKVDSKWLLRTGLFLMGFTVLKYYIYDFHEIFDFRDDYSRIRGGWTQLVGVRMLTSAVVLGSLWKSAQALVKSPGPGRLILGMSGPAIVYTVFVLSLFFNLNAEVAALSTDISSKATAASLSVLWAAFSLGLMMVGFAKNIGACRKAAIWLFGLTVIKVLVIDMQQASTPFRIVSSIGLGLLLIGAAYLYYQFKERILPTEGMDEPEAGVSAEAVTPEETP